MRRALLAFALLLGSASAETGFDDRDRPKSNRGDPPAEWSGADNVQSARIVGGAPVTPFEHNWVLQWRGGGSSCGASLIDDQWAMTAAHCTQGTAASSMQVCSPTAHANAPPFGAGCPSSSAMTTPLWRAGESAPAQQVGRGRA